MNIVKIVSLERVTVITDTGDMNNIAATLLQRRNVVKL